MTEFRVQVVSPRRASYWGDRPMWRDVSYLLAIPAGTPFGAPQIGVGRREPDERLGDTRAMPVVFLRWVLLEPVGRLEAGAVIEAAVSAGGSGPPIGA
jgi:hypothetical protein